MHLQPVTFFISCSDMFEFRAGCDAEHYFLTESLTGLLVCCDKFSILSYVMLTEIHHEVLFLF